jgi:hypothetical protein
MRWLTRPSFKAAIHIYDVAGVAAQVSPDVGCCTIAPTDEQMRNSNIKPSRRRALRRVVFAVDIAHCRTTCAGAEAALVVQGDFRREYDRNMAMLKYRCYARI